MKLINNFGFSLLEILVAITIISIVFGFIINSFSAAQKSGRNTQRQSDLRKIQSALEHYNADQTFYPSSLPAVGESLTNQVGRPAPFPLLKTYLQSMPADPQSNLSYGYQIIPGTCDNSINGNCYNYCLYANLETTTASIPSSCPPLSGYNFAITQP